MRILIFAGGTGSTALQDGLYRRLELSLDGIYTKVLVNAYDNGLSTGAVRDVMGGQILGPSDVRKNQATRLRLENPTSAWLPFLDDRFTITAGGPHAFCSDRAAQFLTGIEKGSTHRNYSQVIMSAIDEYFASPRATTIDYRDFSLANMVYAGLAKANGNSLRTAAKIMSELMGIPDSVLLNDDKSLFLGAITRSGRRIADEGEIVSWGNCDDPFVDVFFTDAAGIIARPELCLEAWRAILEADLIILSSGTQWSSLIPTYASDGFKRAIALSKATVVMVMNRTPDRDSPSQTASDILNILIPRYFDQARLRVLADENGHPHMRTLNGSALSKVGMFVLDRLSCGSTPPDKHDSVLLAKAIGRIAFSEHLGSDVFVFDYDDTLVGRNGSHPKSSRFNVNALAQLNEVVEVGVCTGNDINAVHLKSDRGESDKAKPLLIFADGGANKYVYDTRPFTSDEPGWPRTAECISPGDLLPISGPYSVSSIIERLKRIGMPIPVKIDNRGGALISIKPVDQEYRDALLLFVQHILDGSDLEVRECGRTTVEICKPALSKGCTIRYLSEHSGRRPRITYVGDELESGNDNVVSNLAVRQNWLRCLPVRSPAKTAFFISTLIEERSKDAER